MSLRVYCADIKLVQADDALQICKEVTDLLSLGRICRKVCSWDGGDEVGGGLRWGIRRVQRDGIGRDLGSLHGWDRRRCNLSGKGEARSGGARPQSTGPWTQCP